MATKTTFWDTHDSETPEEYTIRGDRYLKAVYILCDTAVDEDSMECDYGIFNCGFGDGTLNTDDRFGSVWKSEYPTTPQGYRYKKPIIKASGGGMPLYKHRKRLRYPDTLQWVIHKEADGEVWLYRPQLLESDGCRRCYGRGLRGYNVTGWSFSKILDNCRKDGFNGNEVRQRQGVKTRVIGPRTGFGIDREVMWSKELDGKSVIPLLASRPKMTLAEIINVIVNEGGSVDENLIVHAGK